MLIQWRGFQADMWMLRKQFFFCWGILTPMITLIATGRMPLSFCHMTPYMWCTVLIRVKPSRIPSSYKLWNKFKCFLKNGFFCSRCSSDESAEWSLKFKFKLKWAINQNPQLCCQAVREWKRLWAVQLNVSASLFRMEFKHTDHVTMKNGVRLLKIQLCITGINDI